MYDYNEAMKQDIMQAIEDNYDLADYNTKDEAYEAINDDLWIDDSVTGNASGSYTFCRATAKEYVQDNIDLAMEACREFGTDAETFG